MSIFQFLNHFFIYIWTCNYKAHWIMFLPPLKKHLFHISKPFVCAAPNRRGCGDSQDWDDPKRPVDPSSGGHLWQKASADAAERHASNGGKLCISPQRSGSCFFSLQETVTGANFKRLDLGVSRSSFVWYGWQRTRSRTWWWFDCSSDCSWWACCGFLPAKQRISDTPDPERVQHLSAHHLTHWT